MIIKDIPVSCSGAFAQKCGQVLVPGDVQAYRVVYKTPFDLSGAAFSVTAIREDGSTVADMGTVQGDTGYYTLKNSMYSQRGTVSLRLTIHGADGVVLTAKELILDVVDGVESGISADDRVPVLDSLISQATTAANTANTAANAANAAAGTAETAAGAASAAASVANTAAGLAEDAAETATIAANDAQAAGARANAAAETANTAAETAVDAAQNAENAAEGAEQAKQQAESAAVAATAAANEAEEKAQNAESAAVNADTAADSANAAAQAALSAAEDVMVTIAVDSTATGAPGTDAQVENVGTSKDARLKFTIPRGEQGPQGPQGLVQVAIGDTEPDYGPCLWFNTGNLPQEATLELGEVTAGTPVRATIDDIQYGVENASVDGVPAGRTYDFKIY